MSEKEEIEQIKQQINYLIHIDNNCEVKIQDYSNANPDQQFHSLDVLTCNPRHNTWFLAYENDIQFKDGSLLDLYKKALEFFSKKSIQSWTVEWYLDSSQKHKSWFYARDLFDLAHKIYATNDWKTLTIYSIKINPES